MTATIARVVDLETTGRPQDEGAEIIEFGACDLDIASGKISGHFSTLIRPRGPITPETKAVHHITEKDVKDAPELREVWDEFFFGLGDDDILVAHRADFERHFIRDVPYRWIDTFKVARIVWPDAPNHQNQTLRYWLNLPVDADKAWPPHRAMPDAYVTAHLLARLMTEKTIDEMVTISTFPALAHIVTYGKDHKGKHYRDVPSDYLEWVRDKSSMDEDTKFSARYWLQKRRA